MKLPRMIVAMLVAFGLGMLLAVSLPAQTAADTARQRAVKRWTDSTRFLLRNTQTCRTAACLANVRAMQTRIDSILSAALKPVVPPVVTPPPDTQPTPVPTPPSSGKAELPRALPPANDPYPGKLCTITVASMGLGADVNSAYQSARGGAVVCLPANVPFDHVVIPARAVGDTGWIVSRTVGLTIPEGMRATPSAGAQFATIRTTNVECALRTTPGTYGWYIAGIRFTTTASTVNNPATYNIVCLGAHDSTQDTAAEIPQRIVLSRVIVDGGVGGIQNCVTLNSGSTAIVDSWLMNCHWKGGEGHGIASYNGPGPFLIQNTHIEAAGINVLFGGSTPRVANLRAADVTIRRNHLYKPLAWGPPGTQAGPWTEKNLLELKNAQRVLIEANVLENSWQDAQPTGSGIMVKSINDENTCFWCQSTDITIRWNLMKNVETPIVLSATENYNNVTNPPPLVERLTIVDNVFEDAGSVAWGAKGFQLTSGHSKTTGAVDVVIQRNVIAQGAGKIIAHGLLLSTPGLVRAVITDNVLSHAAYPIFCDLCSSIFGAAGLAIGAPNVVWSNNTLVKSPNHTDGTPVMPAGTVITTTEPPLAAQIRADVQQRTAGVVIPP